MTPYLRREEQVEEAEISSSGMAKIGAVYSEGGAQTAIQTVENDFNVRVDQYVSGVTELLPRSARPERASQNRAFDEADNDIGGVAGKSGVMCDIGRWF